MKTKAMFFLLSCLFTSLSFAVVKDSDINKALDEQRTSAIFKVNNKPEVCIATRAADYHCL